jgi:hypothetical protein
MTDAERIDRLERLVLDLAHVAADGRALRDEVAIQARAGQPDLSQAFARLAEFEEAVTAP